MWDQVIKNLKNTKQSKKEQMLDIDRIYKYIYDLFYELKKFTSSAVNKLDQYFGGILIFAVISEMFKKNQLEKLVPPVK